MAEIKSVLKPENSIIAGVAVIGLVWGNYAIHNGSAAETSMTEAFNPHTVSANKKAGYTSLIMVAGISLITRDANIFILGASAIILLHTSFIHSIAMQPGNAQIAGTPQAAAAYTPAAASA